MPGLLAALCCRAVTIITEQEKEFSKSQSGKKNPPVEADGETSDGIQGKNMILTSNMALILELRYVSSGQSCKIPGNIYIFFCGIFPMLRSF